MLSTLTLLSILLCSPALGADVPDTSWAPSSARVRPYHTVTVDDWELWGVSERPRVWGAARVDGRTLRGKPAFREALARIGTEDATALARLACMFLESNLAGTDPWRTDKRFGPAAQQALATDPVVEGGVLTYWRRRGNTADLARVRVDLTELTFTSEGAVSLLDAADPRDPVERAREEVASDDLTVVRKGIQRLMDHGQPTALALVLDVAAHHQYAKVRTAAVEGLRAAEPPTGVAALSQVLATDPDEGVRTAAVKTLQAWGNPASATALATAAKEDRSARVRALAGQGLGQ